MSVMADTFPRKLDWGRVVSQTAAVLGRQPALIFGQGIVLGALPSIVNAFTMQERLANPMGMWTSPFYWAQTLGGILFTSFLQAAIYYVVFTALGNRKPTLREAVVTGAKFFLPLFAVNLFYYLAFALGVLLLIVPGVMLGIAWCVAGPALIAERSGITAVFGRSAELTRGHRWSIFGLSVVMVIALLIIEGVLGAIGITRGFNFMAVAATMASPAMVIGAGVVSGLITAIGTTVLATLYAELRELKDGTSGESLAEIFD
ncbi:MAG: hypothetical protein JWP86_392 [Phenylobacterium sp.]|nr:hypothetical protein [Phenylobacterium sp.]